VRGTQGASPSFAVREFALALAPAAAALAALVLVEYLSTRRGGTSEPIPTHRPMREPGWLALHETIDR